jgi:hypothetical protein
MAVQYIEKFLSSAQIGTAPNAAGIGVIDGVPYLNADGSPAPLQMNVLTARDWFVDATASASGGLGIDTNAGRSWAAPFLTMSKAFTSVRSGDRIFFKGKVREQLTTPVQVFDVTIIGSGNRPRHADSAPANGDFASNTWTTPGSPAATTPLVKVLQQGWRFVNVLFAGPTDAACVLLFRDNGAGDAERDASHAEFVNCRFASGQDGIEQSGGAGHVGIYHSFFTSLTGVAIKHTTGAGAGFPIRYEIIGNRFNSCPSIMTAVAAQDYRIQENSFVFAVANTLVFDFTGGARNVVVRNDFNIAAVDFDPVGHVTGSGVTDVWSNTLTDAIESGLPAN